MTPDEATGLRSELADLRKEVNERFNELEKRLETRIAAAEQQTDLHEKSDVSAFAGLRHDFAALKNTVLGLESSHEATSMAQMHILGLVARKVGVSQKELKKVRGM